MQELFQPWKNGKSRHASIVLHGLTLFDIILADLSTTCTDRNRRVCQELIIV